MFTCREKLAEDRDGITICSLETEEELSNKIEEIDMSEEERKEKKQNRLEGIVNFGSVLQSEDEGVRHFRQIEIKFKAATHFQKVTLTQLELLDNLNNVFTIEDVKNVNQGKKVKMQGIPKILPPLCGCVGAVALIVSGQAST